MNNNVQVNEEELKEIYGGTEYGASTYGEVTTLLKEAGERAWAVLGRYNDLWSFINTAEKTFSLDIRRQNIDQALSLLQSMKHGLNKDDYEYIHQRLTESKDSTPGY